MGGAGGGKKKKKNNKRSSGGIQHAWITSGHHSDLKAGNIFQKGKKIRKGGDTKDKVFFMTLSHAISQNELSILCS